MKQKTLKKDHAQSTFNKRKLLNQKHLIRQVFLFLLYYLHMSQITKHSSAAKDVFSYLLMIIMLYMGVISFVTLLWQYIEVRFPDNLNFYFADASGGIRGAISILLIVWPVMMFMSWLIHKDLIKEPTKKDSWIRRWLLYLTLFLSAMTIVIDLITLTNSFLSGEITTRFILKVVVVLLVAIAVFTYYLWELRRNPANKTTITRIAALLTATIILGSVAGGFFIIGSPVTQRSLRMDEKRVQDLQSIQSQIMNQWTAKGSIPGDLVSLNDPIYGFVTPTDPVTHAAYGYQKTGDHAFELCADFEKDSLNSSNPNRTVPAMYPQGGGMDYWTHGVGHTCFTRTIDPELFKPSAKTVPAVPLK